MLSDYYVKVKNHFTEVILARAKERTPLAAESTICLTKALSHMWLTRVLGPVTVMGADRV